jgi:hypothetical protein
VVCTGKELEQGRSGFPAPPKPEDEGRSDPDPSRRIVEEAPNLLGCFRIVAPFDPDDRLPTHAIGFITEGLFQLRQRTWVADAAEGESACISDESAVVPGERVLQNPGGAGVVQARERIGRLRPNVPVGILKSRFEGNAAFRKPDPTQGRSRSEPKAIVRVRQCRFEGGPGTRILERS